ncbi:hypothetical protein [uncultured Ruminococcus sp.]|uniref:hypothetical protein n=1 Tax=uncultured Ruminococcus sp. TaxID=165186 RepID=UPI0026101B87|nr:hypothetical protein [uncultured Ruminococcus sp.]
MTNESNRNKVGISHLKLPSLWEISIVLLLMYAFFFQYSVITINSAMLVLNTICILFGIVHLISGVIKGKKTFYSWIIAFVFISVLFSISFGVSISTSIDIGIRMIEYCLTGLSILLFCISRDNRFKKVLFITWLSIVLLAINVLLHGTVVDYLGAIGLGSLNTNEMSSFFILVVFCAFYIYGNTDNRIQKLIIWISLLLVFIIQIQSASRRGFIVMVFMIVMNIIYGVIPYSNQKNTRRRLVAYSIIIIAGAAAFVELRIYILNNTILGERLVGTMTGGDAARARYHAFALEQFKKNPVFGVGIGGITYLQGVYSHSLFYETISCTGIIGALIMIIGLVKATKELIVRLINNRSEVQLNNRELYLDKVVLIYLLGLFVSGFAVVMIYDFYFYLSLSFIATAILLNRTKLQNELMREDAI